MIRSAKNTTKKLLVEDSGIAMPISLLVFLFLTFVCMSVFALGEVIRARTELQYKVDNAAYAAALVQADSLSRIAVLNRALAWTYAQTNNRQVNYIMNRWLSETYDAFIEEASECESKHFEMNTANQCALHNLKAKRVTAGFLFGESDKRHTTEYVYGTDDLCYGLALEKPTTIPRSPVSGWKIHGRLRDVEGRDIVELEKILEKVGKYEYLKLAPEIAEGKKNINELSNELKKIKDNMNDRAQLVVKNILKGMADSSYYVSSIKPDWLEKMTEEKDVFDRYETQVEDFSKEDIHWQNLGWWVKNDSLSYSYKEGVIPELKWIGYAVQWACDGLDHIATKIDSKPERKTSPGNKLNVASGTDVPWEVGWDSIPEAGILKLNESFFSKNGAVVVAARKDIPDLFGNVFGKNKFLNFRVNGNLWAVSAARAGYRNGEKYENSKFLNEDEWNLFKDDWEPMFLPVGRCWKSWDGEKFTGDGADKVLKAVGLEFDEKVNLDMLH